MFFGLNDVAFLGSLQPPVFLLDFYPNAAAAYSLRQLRTGVTNVVRVRRSSDNTESDFTAAQISDGTLTTFCGAGNGFVRTWYDQSGNTNHAQQATSASQPQIVSSGSLVTTNSKPSIQFGNSVGVMTATVANLASATNLSAFSVTQPAAASLADTNTIQLFGFAGGGASFGSNGFQVGAGTGALSGETICVFFTNNSINAGRLGSSGYSHTANQQLLHRSMFLASGFVGAKNGSVFTMNLVDGMTTATDVSPVAANAANSTIHICSLAGVASAVSQNFQELVFYPTNQTANVAAIESNINAHYAIY
jgi:hypothetical protein